jgi:hypothetical protein
MLYICYTTLCTDYLSIFIKIWIDHSVPQHDTRARLEGQHRLDKQTTRMQLVWHIMQ